MKAAFSVWNDRIAPVFDVAQRLHLVEVAAERRISAAQIILMDVDPSTNPALRVVALDVTILVCGAISRPLHHQLMHSGIRVIPFVAGELRPVIAAWLEGRLNAKWFAMPGCRKRQKGHLWEQAIHD